jgi:hypothetical protein
LPIGDAALGVEEGLAEKLERQDSARCDLSIRHDWGS